MEVAYVSAGGRISAADKGKGSAEEGVLESINSKLDSSEPCCIDLTGSDDEFAPSKAPAPLIRTESGVISVAGGLLPSPPASCSPPPYGPERGTKRRREASPELGLIVCRVGIVPIVTASLPHNSPSDEVTPTWPSPSTATPPSPPLVSTPTAAPRATLLINRQIPVPPPFPHISLPIPSYLLSCPLVAPGPEHDDTRYGSPELFAPSTSTDPVHTQYLLSPKKGYLPPPRRMSIPSSSHASILDSIQQEQAELDEYWSAFDRPPTERPHLNFADLHPTRGSYLPDSHPRNSRVKDLSSPYSRPQFVPCQRKKFKICGMENEVGSLPAPWIRHPPREEEDEEEPVRTIGFEAMFARFAGTGEMEWC